MEFELKEKNDLKTSTEHSEPRTDKKEPRTDTSEKKEKKELVECPEGGLTSEEAARRLAEQGPNALPEKDENQILKFLKFFWNPLSWVMEIAAIVSIILLDYVDFALIFALLVFNAFIGFYEEKSAGNALKSLRSQLAPNSVVMRDGEVITIPARNLVQGDKILLKLGDIVPADSQIIHSQCKVDQSSFTGESLPVTKYPGDEIFGGSTLKEGEIIAVVTATGERTVYGKAAGLIQGTQNEGHLQKVLTYIGFFCISFILFWVIIELIVQFGVRGKPCPSPAACYTLLNCLVPLVGGIPIAMPTVLSVTMALGAYQLAKKKAIVSRLTAIEELAGMDILCSDKTGTLTLNQLTIDTPVTFEGKSVDEVLLDSLLASRTENMDAIDTAVFQSCQHIKDQLKNYKILNFFPFDPVGKKTMAQVMGPGGNFFHVSKGAPNQILNLCTKNNPSEHGNLIDTVTEYIEDYADRGYRVLGVARSNNENLDGTEVWTMVGLLPIFDPPRPDTASTVERVKEMGIKVKMITGDHLAIAKETGTRLGIGNNMFTSKSIEDENSANGVSALQRIEAADGFAEVFPEHKFDIVKRLQKGGHCVGMTGDGVNDAPALKKADIGIAVAGATEAAKAAADIILTEAGLSVIVDALIGSRKIFQRMKNYCTYSVTTCVRIATTFSLLTLIYDFYFPTLVIVIVAILNDGTMITISKDRVRPSKNPDEWKLGSIFFKAIVFGLYLVASTMVLFALAHDTTFFTVFGMKLLNPSELRGLVYMQVSISGSAVIFVTRSHRWSWTEKPGVLLGCAFVLSQTCATLIGIFGFNGYPDPESAFDGCGWDYALFIWFWCVLWYLPMDFIKLGTGYVANNFYRHYSSGRVENDKPDAQEPLIKRPKVSRFFKKSPPSPTI